MMFAFSYKDSAHWIDANSTVQFAEYNQTFSLECTICANPDPSYMWYKTGQKIENQVKYSKSSFVKRQTLLAPMVTSSGFTKVMEQLIKYYFITTFQNQQKKTLTHLDLQDKISLLQN